MGTNLGRKDSGTDLDPQAPAGISASPRGDSSQAASLERQVLQGLLKCSYQDLLGTIISHLPPAGIPPTELKALDLSSCLGWDYLENPCLIQTLSKPQAVGFPAILQSFKHFIMASFLEES